MSTVPPQTDQRPRLLTGDRPTGPLHLGHWVGSLQTRVALQDSHECFIIVADLHTLTTRPRKEHIGSLPSHVRQVVLDLLSVGIDPDRSTIYLQSGVPAVYDLAILLQMLIPKARLEGIRSVRAMANSAGIPDEAISVGLLCYPALQAADILMARAEVVPVGMDNVEHVDIAREVASAFNDLYGDVFPIPEARISRWPALPGVGTGLGGSSAKMSKSLGNAVFLHDSPADVARKLRTIEVDPDDPGTGPIFDFLGAFIESEQELAHLKQAFAAKRASTDDLHNRLIDAVERRMEPLRARRAEFSAEDGRIEELLVDGTIRAREVAYKTLQRVREVMGLETLWEGLVEATQRRAEARKRPY